MFTYFMFTCCCYSCVYTYIHVYHLVVLSLLLFIFTFNNFWLISRSSYIIDIIIIIIMFIIINIDNLAAEACGKMRRLCLFIYIISLYTISYTHNYLYTYLLHTWFSCVCCWSLREDAQQRPGDVQGGEDVAHLVGALADIYIYIYICMCIYVYTHINYVYFYYYSVITVSIYSPLYMIIGLTITGLIT